VCITMSVCYYFKCKQEIEQKIGDSTIYLKLSAFVLFKNWCNATISVNCEYSLKCFRKLSQNVRTPNKYVHAFEFIATIFCLFSHCLFNTAILLLLIKFQLKSKSFSFFSKKLKKTKNIHWCRESNILCSILLFQKLYFFHVHYFCAIRWTNKKHIHWFNIQTQCHNKRIHSNHMHCKWQHKLVQR
jgi:hypothetical protein